MNSGLRTTLLTIFACITLHAGDDHISNRVLETPTIPTSSAEEIAQQDAARREELRKATELIRTLAVEHNIQINEDDIALQANLKIACAQIHAQTGVLMSPTELFNNMGEACTEIGTWKSFCNEHGIPYIAPMQLFEQLITVRSEKNKAENKSMITFGAGALLGGIGGIVYADPIRNALKTGGAFALAQAAENHQQLTKTLPLTPNQRLGLNISLDTVIAACKYRAGAIKSMNPAIISAARVSLEYEEMSTFTRLMVEHTVREHHKGSLPVLATIPVYNPTYKDYALLTADSIASNLIDYAPLPENNTVYLTCNDSAYTLVSQNQLLQAGKESGKEIIHRIAASYLSSNQVKSARDSSKITKPTVKEIGSILVEHTAKELSYGLVAQLAHKKIAPAMSGISAAFLKDTFPEDGIPKNGTQEVARLVTIGTITFCAAAGLTLAKNAGSWTLQNVISPYVGRMGS